MNSSIRRTDIMSLSGLRLDGRKPQELRHLRAKLGPLNSSNCYSGSALVEMGLTVVLAVVHGPLSCTRRSEERPDRAVLDVIVQSTPFSSGADRYVTTPSTDRRLIEASQFVQKALEATIMLHLFPRSRIEIQVTVLADDGGRWCAALNAATLALMDAGIPLLDMCCACTASIDTTTNGFSNSSSCNDATCCVDLNRREETTQASLLLHCALLPQRNTLVWTQCQARVPQDEKQLDALIEAAMDGCRAVFTILQAAVRNHAASQIRAQAGQAQITATVI